MRFFGEYIGKAILKITNLYGENIKNSKHIHMIKIR